METRSACAQDWDELSVSSGPAYTCIPGYPEVRKVDNLPRPIRWQRQGTLRLYQDFQLRDIVTIPSLLSLVSCFSFFLEANEAGLLVNIITGILVCES